MPGDLDDPDAIGQRHRDELRICRIKIEAAMEQAQRMKFDLQDSMQFESESR